VFTVRRERKCKYNLCIFSFNKLQELKKNDADYRFGSIRQVNFGFGRLRRRNPEREHKLE